MPRPLRSPCYPSHLNKASLKNTRQTLRLHQSLSRWFFPRINAPEHEENHSPFSWCRGRELVELSFIKSYWMTGVRFRNRGRDFFCLPQRSDHLWGSLRILSNGYRGLSHGVKRSGYEADHSSLSNAEVKNAWSCASTIPKSSWRDTWLSTETTLPLVYVFMY